MNSLRHEIRRTMNTVLSSHGVAYDVGYNVTDMKIMDHGWALRNFCEEDKRRISNIVHGVEFHLHQLRRSINNQMFNRTSAL